MTSFQPQKPANVPIYWLVAAPTRTTQSDKRSCLQTVSLGITISLSFLIPASKLPRAKIEREERAVRLSACQPPGSLSPPKQESVKSHIACLVPRGLYHGPVSLMSIGWKPDMRRYVERVIIPCGQAPDAPTPHKICGADGTTC